LPETSIDFPTPLPFHAIAPNLAPWIRTEARFCLQEVQTLLAGLRPGPLVRLSASQRLVWPPWYLRVSAGGELGLRDLLIQVGGGCCSRSACSGVIASQAAANSYEMRFGQQQGPQPQAQPLLLRLRWLQRTGRGQWEAGACSASQRACRLAAIAEHQPKPGQPRQQQGHTQPCCCGARGKSRGMAA